MTYTGNQQHRKRHDDKSYLFLLSIPCGRGDILQSAERDHEGISTHAPAGGATSADEPSTAQTRVFLLTPLREGRPEAQEAAKKPILISTHAPAGGATATITIADKTGTTFLLTPLREGRPATPKTAFITIYFYSRPCGRGDAAASRSFRSQTISTHAPAGGATDRAAGRSRKKLFLLTPLREGRPPVCMVPARADDFYSRPCGRGD